MMADANGRFFVIGRSIFNCMSSNPYSSLSLLRNGGNEFRSKLSGSFRDACVAGGSCGDGATRGVRAATTTGAGAG